MQRLVQIFGYYYDVSNYIAIAKNCWVALKFDEYQYPTVLFVQSVVALLIGRFCHERC